MLPGVQNGSCLASSWPNFSGSSLSNDSLNLSRIVNRPAYGMNVSRIIHQLKVFNCHVVQANMKSTIQQGQLADDKR